MKDGKYDIVAFLKVVWQCRPVSPKLIDTLADRFNIHSSNMEALIQVAVSTKGSIYINN